MANHRPQATACQEYCHPNGLRSTRRMGLHLVVPRACQRDRYPLALLAALAYLGGEASLASVAAYWGASERTVRRWTVRARLRGWTTLRGCNIKSSTRGQEAWRAAFKEKVPKEMRGQLPLTRLALWGRLRRRRAFGTRLMAQDVRCSRRTVQRALGGRLFGLVQGVLGRLRTPLRWALLPFGHNVAPPRPSYSWKSSIPPRPPPREPSRGSPRTLRSALDEFASGLGLS